MLCPAECLGSSVSSKLVSREGQMAPGPFFLFFTLHPSFDLAPGYCRGPAETRSAPVFRGLGRASPAWNVRQTLAKTKAVGRYEPGPWQRHRTGTSIPRRVRIVPAAVNLLVARLGRDMFASSV